MKIKAPKTENDYLRINDFFGKIWKEEFNLDRFNCIEEYKKSKIFFIEENEKIISAINFFRKDGIYFIGRFGTLKEFRGNGIGKKIFKYALDFLEKSKEKEVTLMAEITKVGFYENFGFKKEGEPKEIGNTKSIFMRKIF